MNRIFKAFLLLVTGMFVFSCNKDDNNPTKKPEPYDTQYVKDLEAIETFLKEYHMDVDPVTYEVAFEKITDANGLTSIWNEFPLEHKMVNDEENKVDYKVYYIKFREGTNLKPTRVDSVYVSYRGEYIYKKKEEILPSTDPKTYNEYIASKQFDQSGNPIWMPLTSLVRGWSEILPLFKSGTSSYDAATGVISYENFGAGVFFLPSGLGYYASGSSSIPSYAPLIFSIKLNHVNYIDHDFDGIDSYLEDINGNGDFTDDDTDNDGIQNYLDRDDDGDGFLTKYEIMYVNPLDPDQVKRYYPFNGAATDDPTTPYVDETQGIPDCSGNYTSSTRLRKHLDKNCH